MQGHLKDTSQAMHWEHPDRQALIPSLASRQNSVDATKTAEEHTVPSSPSSPHVQAALDHGADTGSAATLPTFVSNKLKGFGDYMKNKGVMQQPVNKPLLDAISSATANQLLHRSVVEHILQLVADPSSSDSDLMALRGVFNFAQKIISDRLLPRTLNARKEVSNDFEYNRGRLHAGQCIIATCQEVMTSDNIKPYDPSYVPTPTEPAINKRYRMYIRYIAGQWLFVYTFVTKEGLGWSGVGINGRTSVFREGADHSNGSGIIVLTDQNEPHDSMLWLVERRVFMGDHIEISDAQVSDDSVVRLHDFDKDKIESSDYRYQSLKSCGISEKAAQEYRRYGLPRPGEVLRADGDRVRPESAPGVVPRQNRAPTNSQPHEMPSRNIPRSSNLSSDYGTPGYFQNPGYQSLGARSGYPRGLVVLFDQADSVLQADLPLYLKWHELEFAALFRQLPGMFCEWNGGRC